MEWLGSAIEKFGIPTGVMLVLLFFIWRAGIWFRDKVATPVVEKHLKLIDKLEANDDKQTEALDRISDTMSQLACVNGRPNASSDR